MLSNGSSLVGCEVTGQRGQAPTGSSYDEGYSTRSQTVKRSLLLPTGRGGGERGRPLLGPMLGGYGAGRVREVGGLNCCGGGEPRSPVRAATSRYNGRVANQEGSQEDFGALGGSPDVASSPSLPPLTVFKSLLKAMWRHWLRFWWYRAMVALREDRSHHRLLDMPAQGASSRARYVRDRMYALTAKLKTGPESPRRLAVPSGLLAVDGARRQREERPWGRLLPV